MSDRVAEHGQIMLGRFAGGRDRGVCYQITSCRSDRARGEDFVTMTRQEAWAIAWSLIWDINELEDPGPPPIPPRDRA